MEDENTVTGEVDLDSSDPIVLTEDRPTPNKIETATADEPSQSLEAPDESPNISSETEPEPAEEQPELLESADATRIDQAEVSAPDEIRESDDELTTQEDAIRSDIKIATVDETIQGQDLNIERTNKIQNPNTEIEVPEMPQPTTEPVPVDRRPTHLVPAPIPFDVSYHFTSHEEVIEASKTLERFLSEDSEMGDYGSELVMVYTGAWRMIEDDPAIRESEIGDSYFILPPNGSALEVEGGMALDPKDVRGTLSALRSVIGQGSRVRALQTLEMAEWWSYTGVEIEEPALVVETSDGLKQYLFFFEQGKIAAVEELDALPDLL